MLLYGGFKHLDRNIYADATPNPVCGQNERIAATAADFGSGINSAIR